MAKNIFFDLKTKGIIQYAILFSAVGILGYAVIVAVTKKNEKNNSTNIKVSQVINPALINNDNKQVDLAGVSANRKRVEQQLKIDIQRSKNINEVYLPIQFDVNKKEERNNQVAYNVVKKDNVNNLFGISNSEVNLTKEKKVEQKTKENENKKKNKSQSNNIVEEFLETKPKPKKEEKKKEVKKRVLGNPILIETRVNRNNLKKRDLNKEIKLYASYYNAMYPNPGSINGGLYVFSTDETTSGNSIKSTMNNNNLKENNTKTNNLNSNKINERLKIIPGSSYFAMLTIPIDNIYANAVKPIAKIVDKNLKGYVLIGSTEMTSNNSGLILKFNKIVSPDGHEYPINAVGINVKDLTPKFADKIDRHLLPKMVLATLATIADSWANNGKYYTSPSATVLSKEIQKELQTYQTEITANRQYFLVIFY